MKVTDEILNEWSFRCHDGIVDLNNPEKIKILFEILKEDIDDDILNALVNTNDDIKVKVLKYLNNIEKNTSGDLKSLLEKKLGDLYKPVLFETNQAGQEDELLEYLESSDQVTLENLIGKNGENLNTLLDKTNLDPDFIYTLIQISGNIGNVAVGRGEVALITLLKNAKKAGKGDIEVDNKSLEIKSRSNASGAILVPEGGSLTRGSSERINSLLANVVSNIFSDEDISQNLIKYIITKGKKGSWPAKIEVIYKSYLSQGQDVKPGTTFEDELGNVFKNLYGEYAPNVKDYLNNGDFKTNTFKIDLAKTLAKAYYDQKKFDYLMFINPNLDYNIYEEETFLEEIGNKIKVAGYSDSLPRLSI
jgi:hypothetical protein